MHNPALETRRKANAGTGWYAWLARAGLVAKGASFAIVGVLALKLALGDGGKATSREGALQDLARHSFGRFLLVALAVGFAAYALWRFVQAYAERDPKEKKWAKRVGYIARGLIYSALAYSTVRILVEGHSGQPQNKRAHKTAAMIFDWPAGRYLVGAVGIAIVGAGVWNLYRGLTTKFEDRW